MNNWIDRVKQEKKELDEKFNRLKEFMETAPNNPDIDCHMLYLLTKQMMIMQEYSAVLGERIIEGEKPSSKIAEHIKNRLYETALNTGDAAASYTIAAMAERIDFWINELKDGD